MFEYMGAKTPMSQNPGGFAITFTNRQILQNQWPEEKGGKSKHKPRERDLMDWR
jgi:hypothetical protein